MKKPAMHNGEFLRTETKSKRLFTHDGAVREGERLARRSHLLEAKPVVTGTNEHFEIRIVGGIRE